MSSPRRNRAPERILRFQTIAARTSQPPSQPLFKGIQTPNRRAAAAQASLHRPAPRTRSRATLIPLLRPLDRRKGVRTPIGNTTNDASRLTRRRAYRISRSRMRARRVGYNGCKCRRAWIMRIKIHSLYFSTATFVSSAIFFMSAAVNSIYLNLGLS